MSKARDLADFGSNPDEQTSIITVTVAGGKFVIDGTSQQTITMAASGVYKFDQSDSSNASHPLKISTTSDGTHGGGSAITVDFVAVGTAGSAGAYVTYTIQQDGADNYFYYCGNHSGMGGSIRKSGNPTAAEILTSIKTVDGTGSGLDADTLDGVEAAALMPLSGGTMSGNLAHGDGVKATFGASADLQVYHDAGTSNSFIDEQGSGNLIIRGTNIQIKNSVGSDMADFTANGAARLFFSNQPKMATTSTGIDVTGTVQADQFNNDEALPDVRPSLLLDFANSKTLDPRITFTRGSTATYYDGKTTAKAEENLLPRSQEFDNGQWVTSGTVTANSTTAPDGTTTADTYAGNGVSGLQNITDYVADGGAISGTYAFSVYAKANTNSFIQFLYYGGTGLTYANFDLSTGAVGNYDGTSASITDVGNGWYRCEHVSTLASNTHVVIGLISSSTSIRGEGWSTTNSVYLWGAQLEQRSAVTAYTATSGSPIVKYQPTLQTAASGAARFDHDPVTGESKGLLIEEARTNLVKYSGDLNAATANTGHGWLFGSTLSSLYSYIPAQKIAPDGTQTGVEFVSTANTSQGLFLRSSGISFGAATYTASIWVYVPTQTGVNNWGMLVDFHDQESTVVNGVTSFDQWHRISVTVTISATRSHLDFNIRRNNISPDNDDFFKFYVWGAQVEAGSFPTSYIPTAGSTATRAVEQVTMSNIASELNGQEGTLYVQATPPDYSTGDQRLVSIGSSHSNVVEIFREYSSANFFFAIRNAGTTVAQGSTTWAADTTAKAVIGYKSGDIGFAANGTLIMSNTGTFAGMEMNQMLIGRTFQGGASAWSGEIKKIAYYPKRLSNTTLQAMTSE